MAIPSISVIIPAYNAAAFIGEALDSVLAQSSPPEEVIVVNDGSRDNTMGIIAGYEPRFGGRMIVIDQANAGVAAARNAALRRATGDIVALLDADDYYEPDAVVTLRQAFTEIPDLVIAFGDMELFDASGRLGRRWLSGKPVLELPAHDAGKFRRLDISAFASLLRGSYVPLSASAVRRATALAAGLFDAAVRTSEDRDFFCRLALRGAAAYTMDVITNSRIHDMNLSIATKGTLLAANALYVLRKLRLPEHACLMTDDERQALEAAYDRALFNYAYTVSAAGLRTYVGCVADLPGDERLAALHPKHIARAVAAAVGMSSN